VRRRLPRTNAGIGLLALVVIAALVYLGFTKEIPFRDHYEVRAAFQTANNLKPGSPVRIAGVEIGEVTKVEPAERGGHGAIVTMRVSDEGRPVHADATAKIRPRIFLEGNFFVDLTAGSASAPELEQGDTIPVNQTATPVQLDEVLTALQSDTREDLKTLLDAYGEGLEGAGARGFNRSIPYWEPAYRDTAIVNEALLGETEGDLSGYIDKAGATAAALDRNREQLKSLITDFHTTAGAFAREEGNLRAALDELPRTLRAAHPALGELNEAFPPLRALAVELRPGVQSSGPTIDAAMPFVRELRGLVSEPELRGLTADLRPTVPALAALVDRSIPLYRKVRRAASCQNSVILPWSRQTVPDKHFPAEGPVFEEAPKPLPGLAGESRSGDANGQWFRVLAAGGKNLVTLKPGTFATTPEPLIGANPPKPKSRPPLKPATPCETQQTPDLRSEAAPPPPQRMIDTNAPAFKERYAQARQKAVNWLERQIRIEGLGDRLKIGGEDATLQLLDQIAARAAKGP
jgi:phospholipid/cholesterol/gamma-HCH transport system substrate-binding protein